CYALVAVHERMVRREAIGVGGGELGGVGFAVGGPVQRAREGRIEQARIADAGTAAVLGELLVVRGENDGALDPDPLPHFASSRSTARRFLAMRRTCFICAAKRGSWGVSRRPSGVSVTCSVSPLSTFRRASMSFGRITPTELPIRVSLRAAMVGSNVITSVIIPRPFAGFKSRLGHDDPPGAAAGFRAGGSPVNAISSCDDPKEDLDAIQTVYPRRPGQSHRSRPRTGLGESDRRRIRGFRVPVVRPGLSRSEDAAQALRGPRALRVPAFPARGSASSR